MNRDLIMKVLACLLVLPAYLWASSGEHAVERNYVTASNIYTSTN